ncbi:MAG: DrmE family protein [Lachnospiraceae bacterium]|nr:DrmE family protein [Lachnospiraceae bacterium]
MTANNLISAMLDKCAIYYEDALISKECIIQRYIKFFDKVIDGETHSVNFALHTGSICFDVISVVAVTLGCLSYSLWTNDDIISQLQINDIVMYKNKRYRWGGLVDDYGIKMVLIENPKGKNGEARLKIPYIHNKHLVKPYYGTSSCTDGRGVRKLKTNREEFLSHILGIPVADVPSVINVAVVIVSSRGDFLEICKHLSIVYGERKKIGLLDIVPAAYYTGQEEIQFGTNPTKAAPVLKIAGKMSVARDLVLDKYGNKVVGLLINGMFSLTENCSELADLLRRKSLYFVHIALLLNVDTSDYILDMYEEANIFACTKSYLSKNIGKIKCLNSFTVELEKQIDNIVNNTVSSIPVSGGWTWDEYCRIKRALLLIKQSNWISEQKNEFILSAHGLLNLLTTSVFSMNQMEYVIINLGIGATVLSPKERIDKLWEIADKAGSMEDLCIAVTSDIEKKYYEFMDHSPKALAIKEYLVEHSGRKIAIVVPKAYYTDILILTDILKDNDDDVICVTANRFDATHEYELILVVGDISGKKFDPLQCHSAKNIDILLYECEGKSFNYRKKKKDKSEKRLNAKIRGISYSEEVLEDTYAGKADKEEEIIVQSFSDLEEYIEKLNVFNISKFVKRGLVSNSNSTTSEVKKVGVFVTGEHIFFSKYYTAVVFDYEEGSVTEKAVDKLLPGDFLVFTRRDDYTKNIVDFIFEKLLDTGKLSKNVIEASEKAVYWKDVLRRYKTQGNYTYRDIAKKMRNAGSSLQDVAIRSWLVEDSHIVGPKNAETMGYIAQITQDKKLLNDTDEFFEACRIVRSERRKILELIGKAINDKLSGHIPQEGSALEVVYNNVDNLSETLELENIIELHESTNVSINLVNKPITEVEVLM